MSDLISKSETIDLLYQVFEKHSMATDKNDLLGGFGAELFKNIKAMPTAYSVDKGDMKHNLAEMYAKNMVDYGVDVTKAWQTATQQSYALEKAYVRGRQYEVDRFIELRKEHNDDWIPCSERLPEAGKRYLVSAIWKDKDFEKSAVYDAEYGSNGLWYSYNYEPVSCKVIAWQPLPEPFKERD